LQPTYSACHLQNSQNVIEILQTKLGDFKDVSKRQRREFIAQIVTDTLPVGSNKEKHKKVSWSGSDLLISGPGVFLLNITAGHQTMVL
jgi:hypothetical protein